MTHRFLIETEHAKYPCDDYIIYPTTGIQAIKVSEDETDCFMITAPIEAIHDYQSGISLEKFKEIRENEIKAAKAIENDMRTKAAKVEHDRSFS